jgi:hypothetical protein
MMVKGLGRREKGKIRSKDKMRRNGMRRKTSSSKR